ncbi:FxLYD domain-containing protein [uncultured Gemella sp.]|uniref:FxLYD domain-containing protein n=1 Tax=uncultured Gemella sp. TaxID=254352 RepID=UPI0028EA5333|nr:FxLYD domain-containing protein [uncultured Gemella sp.]
MAKKITDQNGNVYVQKKPIYKRVWFIILAAIVLILIIQQTTGSKKKDVEVKNSAQETQKAKYEVSELNVEKDSFTSYVTGVLKNNTDKEKSYVQVTIPAYDANGNKVGDVLANVNDLKPNATWKFKATYLGSEKNVTFKTEELKVSGF